MTTSNIRPTTIKIDQDTKARMARLAEARQRTPHWLIMEAIKQYVVREEKREALRQAGMQAWQDSQETGLHTTHAEADTWLAALAAGEDVEPPEGHN